jgi:NTP pyrophosphatase (non-canonical NTP hydrolase)
MPAAKRNGGTIMSEETKNTNEADPTGSVRVDAWVRPCVKSFALAMETKLKENDWKRGWEYCSMQYLSMRLTQEREELRKAVERGNPVEVLREAADVANFCMMIADAVSRKHGAA